jgi:hypothetical protein
MVPLQAQNSLAFKNKKNDSEKVGKLAKILGKF